MAIDNQFRINELISSGSRAITSKDSLTGTHTFLQGSKEVVNTPYEHLKGERDGETTGRIEKPKYNEEELKKAVDVKVDELIGAPKKPQPDVVPRELYDDLRRQLNDALARINELETENATLKSQIETLQSEIDALRIQLDVAKLQQAVAENNSQQTQQQYTDLLGDFSTAVIKSTKEGIERVSLEAQVRGLQAQKETLKEQLNSLNLIVGQLESQLAGAAAESAAAASGLSPAESNETFWGFNNDKDNYGGDIGWWTHRRNSKAPKNGDAGELVVQNLRDENFPITSIKLSVSKPSQSGWGNTTKILGFGSNISNSVNTNIEQGAKEQFPIYFNTKIGGGDNSSPSPHNITGPDKEYSGDIGLTITYQDGFVDRANATWVVRKQNGAKWG